jgi:ubiquinone/menaquinone biosynthesis C-methylase UbiE
MARKKAENVVVKPEENIAKTEEQKIVEKLPVILPPNTSTKQLNEVVEIVKETAINYQEFYGEKYFETLRRNGLDIYAKGTWQKMLVFYLNKIFNFHKKNVLDIGCAVGAQASAFADFGCNVTGVDISQYAISRSKFKNVNLICTPAWDMSAVPSDSIDFLYSMYSFNCFPKDKCDKVMSEINRVCKKDAIVFSILHYSNEERIDGNNYYYPKLFWDTLAAKYKMLDGAKNYYKKFMETPAPGWEFMRHYQWQYLLYKTQKG